MFTLPLHTAWSRHHSFFGNHKRLGFPPGSVFSKYSYNEGFGGFVTRWAKKIYKWSAGAAPEAGFLQKLPIR